ncbi:MAG TPA: hypothetical protein VGT79_09150 [Xanthomonadaceae bacterium]|nr:hypothetical protein [Xanthomonadaceae bacterium]
MNANDQDMRLQAEAERAEREGLPTGRDPRVDRYRLIMRALRQPLEPQLPADFDTDVAELALRRDGDGFEDLLVSLLLLAMGIGALLFVGPSLAKMTQAMISITLPPLPWHQVVMAAICIGVVWAIDQGWTRAHPGSRQF